MPYEATSHLYTHRMSSEIRPYKGLTVHVTPYSEVAPQILGEAVPLCLEVTVNIFLLLSIMIKKSQPIVN
jgi:hypothetical protein